MSQHTPGPWSVEKHPGNQYKIGAPIGYVAVIAPHCDERGRAGHDSTVETANANLIAASPELLDALRGIIEIGKRCLTNPKYDGYFDTACALLAKIQGDKT